MSTKDEQEILTLEHYLQLKSERYEFEGQSYLFWEYMRLLNEVKPKYFLLENVMMGEKWERVLSKAIGVNPIEINSSLVSAQNRRRLYWTNIGMKESGLFRDLESIIKQPKDKEILLKDVLESDVDEKYFLSEKLQSWLEKHSLKNGNEFKKKDGNDKSSCLTSSSLSKTNLSTDYIVHNMQKRNPNRPYIQKNKNAGGSGHLSRNDGKTYCLDTGTTNAVEIIGGDFRYDEGFRWRENGKSPTLCLGSENGLSGNALTKINSRIRRLTPIECERLQTVKDNYTNHVSDSQRYKMLGNGWTVDVIAHIFNYM
jgi:DNA (cytosine-5)-methyltransferase 3A